MEDTNVPAHLDGLDRTASNRVSGEPVTLRYTLTVAPSTVARPCQHGWNEHNNHCYKLMNEKVNFKKANQRCKGMGANLASIRDGQENSFIASIISHASGDMVWIGLQHNKWTDGSAFSYRNWAPGQPDDSWFYGGEKCVVIYKKDGKNSWTGAKYRKKGEWNDRKCSELKPFICKKPK
ncbi:snaclec coagulation factor IX/factor X-binding protein subunit A-like [Branchiostoma floridae x Branchiostoma belcheri]